MTFFDASRPHGRRARLAARWRSSRRLGQLSHVRLSLRTALVLAVLASVVPSGVFLNIAWWRTATGVSRELVETLEIQITDAARRSWWGRVAEVQAASQTLREALAAAKDLPSQERILVASTRSSSVLSWLVYIPREGSILAVDGTSTGATRLYRTNRAGQVERLSSAGGGPWAMQVIEAPPGGMLTILGQRWLEETRGWSEPGWVDISATPVDAARAVAYVDPADGIILASMISHDRFSRLLGEIPVGRTGRTYVVGPDGAIVIASHSEKAPRLADLDPVALAAGRLVAARSEEGKNVPEQARVTVAGAGYAVGLSPLWFQGWQLAVIVPEAESLGAINDTIRRVALGLSAFLILACGLTILTARRFVATPISKVVADLALVERFELEQVPRRRSRLREIDRLSEAIVRMSAGLADFAKFIPTDLVRSLLAEGVRAEPGGSRRDITVLFADLAGFTGLSERLGDGVVPVVSAYLDLASDAVAAERGTVDKFIGDAVMAFWGAPRADPNQALNACRSALAISASINRVVLPAGIEGELSVRIGLQSGPAVVGNLGSATRLNYTALGDTVNLASRLEAVNKVYGTTILIGPATRAAAGEAIVVREVDTVAVYGRAEGVRVFELLALADGSPRPDWIVIYEVALGEYRAGRFVAALKHLEHVAAARPADGPTRRLAELCRRLSTDPPLPGWEPVTVLDMK